MESHGCCDRSIIYIYNSGCHFTVFYLFQKEKKILFIDPMGKTGKPDLKNEGYTLYVSETEIQKDGYSCGVIASEIARMLYSNHEVVESYLSKLGLNCDPVNLYGFLPREELDQLCKSFSEKITINYDKSQMKLQGADYRTAHLMCNLTANELYFYALLPPELAHSLGLVEEIPQEEKQKVEEIRSFFIGNSDNVKLFNQEVNKLLWPNQDTPGKSETAPNNVNLQQIKPLVDITNSLVSSGFSNSVNQQEIPVLVNDTQDNAGQPTNNSEKNDTTSQNTKRSKLPIIAASFAITGVATGIAIAVYLEMLAVGIAVGACCLVAAAIIYCCSSPSNSLEKSSAEAVAATIGTP